MTQINDMKLVIVPKSDQINADDLLAGPMTITIQSVVIKPTQEQPVSIKFDDNDRVYRPCKSMRRVMVQLWGLDADDYIGKSLTLYVDPEVKYGGIATGGIRISHMSDIKEKATFAITTSKTQRKLITVLPLVKKDAAVKKANTQPLVEPEQSPQERFDNFLGDLSVIKSIAALKDFWTKQASKFKADGPECFDKAYEAVQQLKASLLNDAQPKEGE